MWNSSGDISNEIQKEQEQPIKEESDDREEIAENIESNCIINEKIKGINENVFEPKQKL